MNPEGKPIPVPRRLNSASPIPKEGFGANSTETNGNILNFPFPGVNANVTNANIASNAKPVPLPRKFIQRLNFNSSDKRKSNANLPQTSEEDLNEPVSDEAKRGTINIFQRGRSIDPFDTDFESSLKDAKLLTAISFPSPLDDISAEHRSRFSTVSSSSVLEDYTNYVEPNSGSAVITLPAKSASNSNPRRSSNSPSEILTEKIRKSINPSPSTIENASNRDRENESSETDGSESIYEPISSYSSSDSGSAFSELPSGLGRTISSGSGTVKDSIKEVENKFASFDAFDFEKDQPQKSSESYKKFDLQSRLAGGLGDYERLKSESLSASMPAIDDKDIEISSLKISQRSTKSVLPSPDPVSYGSAGFFQRNHSNRSSDSAASSVSCNAANNKRNHEYDDVAMEDGNVIFLDNQLNSPPPVENNSNSSIASIVMEFDPLFDPRSSETASKCVVSRTNSEHDRRTGSEKDHRYEYIDGETEQSFGPTISASAVDCDAFPTDFTNPEYFPMQPVLTKREESLKSTTEASGRDSTSTGNVSRKGSLGSTASYDEYESIVPVIPTRSLKEREAVTRSKKKGKSLAILEEDKISSTSTDGKSSYTIATTSSQNILRRLSHTFKRTPNLVKEEPSVTKQETVGTAGPLKILGDERSLPCEKCFEEHLSGARCKFTPFARPSIVFSSNLFRQSGGIGIRQKDFVKRWVVLAKGNLTFYNEKSVVLEEQCLARVAVISKRNEPVVIQNSQELKCFQLNFIGGKNTTMTLAAVSEGERCSWMQKYMEVFAPAFDLSVISSYERGGWCFMKEGNLTSNWNPSWMILKGRTLFYSFVSRGDVCEVDLRKAHSITLNSKDRDHRCPFVDNLDVLTIEYGVRNLDQDATHRILYIQTDTPKLTASWETAVQAAAKNNGTEFHEMQLTMDNVPVIVDKCIDFLYAHGTLAEGIYRQSGSNSRITQLLAEFQKDAWQVQISSKEYSAHDVAGTLKRFFRTLPEPLVSVRLYQKWIDVAGLKDESQKMEGYLELLSQLSEISYNIMKKLICHLYAVHELHEKNLMPLINLAPIWGPTICSYTAIGPTETPPASSYKDACAECEVVKDLIENYYTLFRVDSEERDKEKKMQDALEYFHLGSTKRKCSGDMKFWIYILEKDEGSTINITLTPLSTSNTIIQQLCRIAKLQDCENLALHEVVCQSTLERPLHPSEKVIETVLQWSIWDSDERKDNYLILKKNSLYQSLIPHAKDPLAVYGELKYADSKSKKFVKYNFTFSRAMLKLSKEKEPKESKVSPESSWKIEDIAWYIGSEAKRTPPTKWTFTFLNRNYPFKRSKDEPYFGNVVSCNSEEELHRWIGAMVVGEHPEGLFPSVIV